MAKPLQIAVQHALRGPREVTFPIRGGPAAGTRFSCLTSHKYFFLRDWYEYELLEPTQRFVRPGSIVYDIGAHFGFWTIVFSRLCGSTGRVFAFEPSPENCRRLRHNLEINLIQNVQIVPFAVSDSVGRSKLSENGSMTKIGTGSLEIDTVTLDEFCTHHVEPDFMLIDVEGHAGAVLRGASVIFNRHFVPVICELHNENERAEFRSFMYGKSSNLLNLERGSHLPKHMLASYPR